MLRRQKLILPEAQLARNHGTEITQIPCKNYSAQKRIPRQFVMQSFWDRWYCLEGFFWNLGRWLLAWSQSGNWERSTTTTTQRARKGNLQREALPPSTPTVDMEMLETSKTISTRAILWPVKAIFEKRAATVEVGTCISPGSGWESVNQGASKPEGWPLLRERSGLCPGPFQEESL